MPGNNGDWVGVYPKDSNNDWDNVVSWTYTNNSHSMDSSGITSGTLTLDGITNGDYEARLFLDNSYILEDSVSFNVSDVDPAIHLSKTSFAPYEAIEITVDDLPGYNGDWIGIYPAGSSNDWGNVQSWTYTNQTHSMDNPGIEYGSLTLDGIATGDYEARLFFNNSFDLVLSRPFTVSDNTPSLSISQPSYAPQETIEVIVDNLPGNNGDWIGIYPAGSSNDWDNVQSWTYTNQTHSIDNPGITSGTLSLNGIATGNYEARLFFNNSFDLENSVHFTVANDIVMSNISFDNAIEKHHGEIYYNAEDISLKPTIYIAAGYDTQANLFSHMAESLVKEGYVVIVASLGTDLNTLNLANDYFDAFVQGWSQCQTSGINIDDSRVGLVGHSSGAGILPSLGYKFFVEENFVEQNMGTNGRFIFGTTPWIDFQHDDNKQLPTDTNFVTQWYYDDDSTQPNIYLDMYNYVNTDNKAFITVKTSKDSENLNYVVPPEYKESIGITHYALLADPSQYAIVSQGIIQPLKDLAHYTFTQENKEKIFTNTVQENTYYKITANGALPTSNDYLHMKQAFETWNGQHFNCDGPRKESCIHFSID